MDIVQNGKGDIRLRNTDGTFVKHLVYNGFATIELPIEFPTFTKAEAYRKDLEEKTIWTKIG